MAASHKTSQAARVMDRDMSVLVNKIEICNAGAFAIPQQRQVLMVC